MSNEHLQNASILEDLLAYKTGVAEHSWKKLQGFIYENDYISVVSIDSSNRWISSTEMEKQWSIIIDKKKEFSSLPNFSLLSREGVLVLTPVHNGRNKGCFGIRLYGMKRDPNEEIIKKLLDYIFEGSVLQEEETNILSQLSEEEIEAIFEAEDDSSGFVYKEGLKKVRTLNKRIIDDIKKMYKGECQLCGRKVGEDFGQEIIQAHHIEYFSKTQNNAPSNIIILCPNCHALIHKCNPTYDRNSFSFKFDNGINVPIKNIGHLKGRS